MWHHVQIHRRARTAMSGSVGSRRLRAIAVVVVGTVLALAAAPAHAQTPDHAQRRLGVATYNLYLGADLAPLFGKSGTELVAAAAEAWAHVQATDFHERAESIAELIAEERPHLVGLQEVSLWESAPLANPTALTVEYDFLQILLDELEDRGTPYAAEAVNGHFTGSLPISATTLVRLTQRNVIIARTDLDEDRFAVTNPDEGNFALGLPLTIGGQPITLHRAGPRWTCGSEASGSGSRTPTSRRTAT